MRHSSHTSGSEFLQQPTFRELCLAAGGRAEHRRAAAAGDHCLRVAEDDGAAGGAQVDTSAPRNTHSAPSKHGQQPDAHIWKQPWHLTSMKKALGDCTSRLYLAFCFSSSVRGKNPRSVPPHDAILSKIWAQHSAGLHQEGCQLKWLSARSPAGGWSKSMSLDKTWRGKGEQTCQKQISHSLPHFSEPALTQPACPTLLRRRAPARHSRAVSQASRQGRPRSG